MKSLKMISDGDPVNGKCGELQLMDLPVPEIGEEDVLVKVAYASICGSDPHLLMMQGLPYPFGMGHEMSGVIEAVGSKTTKGLKPGDRVTGNFVRFCGTCHYCRNGQENLCGATFTANSAPAMAEYVAWHESQLYVIPNEVDLLTASLTEPLAISLHAVERSELKIGAKVAVFGGGGIGQMVAQLAKMSGASAVTMIEPVEEKRNLALELGADYGINPLKEDVMTRSLELTCQYGYDAVLECSGVSSAAEAAVNVLAKGGTGVFFSMYNPEYRLPINAFKDLYLEEKTIRGMFMSPYSFPRTIEMLRRVNLRPLIQKVYSLEKYAAAFEDQMSGKYVKIVLKCS